MKKLFLSMLVVVFFLTLSSLAHAWHIEYTFDGNMYYEDNPAHTYLHVSDDTNVGAHAGWAVDRAYDDPAGGVIVEYDDDSGWLDSQELYGYVEFQIVSDYGNMEEVPVSAQVAGEADTEAWVDRMGHDYGLDGFAHAESEVSHDMPAAGLYAEADVWSWGWDDDYDVVEKDIMLFANTPYFFDCILFAEAEAILWELPPTWFDSWDEYDAFFGGEFSGEIFYEAFAGLWFQVSIDGTEPVPLPGTILLLGSGLIGLAGFRRKFSKKNQSSGRVVDYSSA